MFVRRRSDWNTVRSDPALIQGWRHLHACVRESTPFQSFEWTDAWWEAFGAGAEVHLLTVHEGSAPQDRLIGVAPLMISAEKVNGFRHRVLRLIGTRNYSSDYAEPLIEGARMDVLEKILEWAFENPDRWTLLDLPNLPTHSPQYLHLTNFACERVPSSHRARADVMVEAPTRLLDDVEEDRRAASKKSLKRHTNWFRKNGELRFRVLDDRAEALGRLEHFFEQHKARRELAGGRSLFHDPAECRFYRSLVERMLPDGGLHFSVLEFNGEPIAYHFGFVRGGRFYWYKPSFSVEWERRSPGEVLIKHLLEHAIDAGLSEFDFTVGDEPFKYRFANVVRRTARIRVFNSRSAFLIASLRRLAGRASRLRTAARAAGSARPVRST